METIQVTEPQDSDFLGPGLALAPGQLYYASTAEFIAVADALLVTTRTPVA